MFTVRDIYEDAQNILGTCSDTTLFRRVTEAVELIANKGDFDPLLGVVDIRVHDRCITLPPEIETPLAINISGRPTIGHDFLFNFHINGPGDFHHFKCDWTWQDGGESPVYRELSEPSRLIAFVTDPDDAGKELWAYGYTPANEWIRTKEGNDWKDGYRVPTIYGYALPDVGAPIFGRIVRVRRQVTVASVRLSSFDNSLTTGTLIGIYRFDETEPMYRKVRLNMGHHHEHHHARLARIAYRKRTFNLTGLDDLIPLHSSAALLMMIRAVKAYGPDNDMASGSAYESTAMRWITEEQETRSPPVTSPVQINPRNNLVDHADIMD